jgi:pimeloyl-ACP methyl ester carboxylesterase
VSKNDVEGYDVSAINVLHDGPPQETPLLLIHGTAGSVAWWDPVVALLAGRHHVIRVDLPGHGQSPPAASYEVAAQALRVAAVLDDLGVPPVVVVGHSSGGYVATALAEQRRDLVRGVALINVGPSVDAFRPSPTLVRVMLTPPLSRITWARRSTWIRRGLGTAFTRPVTVPDDLVDAVEGMSYEAFRDAPRESSAYIEQVPVPDRLAGLDVPVLVIFGDDDHRWYSSSARSYEIVPNVRLEMLAGIGHTPMFETPEITGRLLLDFTASLRGAPNAASPTDA